MRESTLRLGRKQNHAAPRCRSLDRVTPVPQSRASHSTSVVKELIHAPVLVRAVWKIPARTPAEPQGATAKAWMQVQGNSDRWLSQRKDVRNLPRAVGSLTHILAITAPVQKHAG
jgi:hypothetical protein